MALEYLTSSASMASEAWCHYPVICVVGHNAFRPFKEIGHNIFIFIFICTIKLNDTFQKLLFVLLIKICQYVNITLVLWSKTIPML